MYTLERVNFSVPAWEEAHSGFDDRTLYQSPAWLNFLKATQSGEPVLAVLRNGGGTAGYFTGMIVRKFGLRILGSPFPGWSTSYMGFNLPSAACKGDALQALKNFAFKELRCAHVEFLDRKFSVEDVAGCGFHSTPLNGFEVDLRCAEEEIFARFQPPCRQAIRRAIRLGVSIEEAEDPAFASEYYAQLLDVFAKQRLVPTYGIKRLQELVRYIQPTGKLLLLRARDSQRRSIATGVFLVISSETMYFWGGASWRSYQSLRPNDLLMWTAIKIGRSRGLKVLDMGGSGDYKKKFGGQPISVPWARASSQPFIPILRNTARTWFRLRQRLRSRLAIEGPCACDSQFANTSI